MEESIFKLHIKYDDSPTFADLASICEVAGEVFDSAILIAEIDHPKFADELVGSTAKIKKITEGSIVFDVIIPTIIANVIGDIVVFIFEEMFKSEIKKKKISVYSNESIFAVSLKKSSQISQKCRWTHEEEDLLAKEAVDTYVKKLKGDDVNQFIKNKKFRKIIARHGRNSLTLKMRNIRYILDKEKNNGTISKHTLTIKPFSHFSKENNRAILRYL